MKLFLSVLFLFPLLVFSKSDEISAKRSIHESFVQSLTRIQKTIPQSVANKETPLKNKVPISKINFSSVPMVTSYDELIHLFKLIRDTRFLHTLDNPDFERRISWLYPDDGCFARAAYAGMKIEEAHLIRPAKIFAFGDLMVTTPYSPDGIVSWWYHVSSVVNYMGSIYVLDPALNSQAPILVSDWYEQMKNDEEINGVVCNAYAYDPFDRCYDATADSDKRALKHQERYLNKEWERMLFLGLDPVAFLGENPPWNLVAS